MNTKDVSLIPYGYYCYDENRVCVYWSRNDSLPPQENGHCFYLEKGDRQLSREGGYSSLLWDHCKECGVNLPKEADE